MAEDNDGKKGDCPGRDVLHLGPDIGNGMHPFVRHRADCDMEAGFLKARAPTGNDEAGPPCDGIVRLKHTGKGQAYDVETLYERSHAPTTDVAGSRTGPAMVATDEYRSGWDRIFGSKAPVGQA